jgi:hypothetical protein
MPIRFRCVYCNQLLGISRRKAGTIVRCTTCEGQLIVPDPSDAATQAADSHEHAAAPPADQPQKTEDPGGPGGVFDADEFDAFIEPFKSASGGPALVSPPAPLIRRPQDGAPARTILEQLPIAALTLSRRGLTIAIVLAILGLGLSFAAGLWVGMAMR